MAEGVGRGVLGNAGFSPGLGDGLLDDAFVQVMAVRDARVAVQVVRDGGKDILPAPFAIDVGVLAIKRVWQGRATASLVQILLMLLC